MTEDNPEILDAEELSELEPLDVEEADDIIEADTHALVRRQGVALADEHGEWLGSKPKAARDEGDLYARFVREATAIERLSEEEERLLGLRVRDFGDKNAAKKLVQHNMRLAIKMAHQHRRSWTSLMDLVQEASTGMAIAAKKWDPDLGTRFGTYAAYWIKAQLTKFLMTNARLIHTGNTRSGRRLYFALPKIRQRLLLQGIEPTAQRIAQEVGEDEHEVEMILSRLDAKETSLSAPIGADGERAVIDLISDKSANPEQITQDSELAQLIHQVIAKFERQLDNDRDRAIWKEHLIATEPISLVDLGKRYHVSKQRMGQLAARIKRAFRRHIIDELGPQTQLSWLFNND